jgi:hypothetical protein
MGALWPRRMNLGVAGGRDMSSVKSIQSDGDFAKYRLKLWSMFIGDAEKFHLN